MAARAVVLLSGGLDSATTLAVAREEGYECFALSFDYGQRHARELESARQVAVSLGAARHLTLRLDLRAIGGSALTDNIEVPKGRSDEVIATGIPTTYVPARNTIFLSHALAWAETLGSQDIFIGVNALDYSVSGDTTVWIRGRGWARPMAIEAVCNLPHDDYETIAVNPTTLRLEWRRVTGRFRHLSRNKRCLALRLERGRHITVTEDHSLFTIHPDTAHLKTIKGSAIVPGTPLVVPFDLSGVANAWEDDLQHIDVSDVPASCSQFYQRQFIRRVDGHITNRLGRTLVPVHFPISDDFLYVNDGGRYDASYRARRKAFLQVESLQPLVESKLAFLRVLQVEETRSEWMYDLGVEGAENFLANGVLAHNSGYPDCRPEFVEAFERLANLATQAGVEGTSRFRVHTPLIRLSKAQIVARAFELGVNLSLTWSCYEPEPDGRACGLCDSCLLRKKGFAEARLHDPVPSAH